MLPADPLFHKPKSIIAAKNILYATLFLSVINWAINQWTTDLYRGAPVQGIITLIVTLLVIFILIKQIGFGRKWARVVLLVLIVAGMLIFPWTLSALFKANLLVGVISLLQAILEIAALVFLFSKESTQWFNRVHITAQDEPVPGSGK
jgi:hypothetical protein